MRFMTTFNRYALIFIRTSFSYGIAELIHLQNIGDKFSNLFYDVLLTFSTINFTILT